MSYVLSSIPAKAAYHTPSNAAQQWAAQLPPEPIHLGRLLITFCIGVVAALAWQSEGDVAREMIANSAPRLSWLAPSVALGEQAAAAPSPDQKAGDITNRLQAVEQDIADKILVPTQGAAVPALKPPPRPSPPEGPRPGR